MNNATLAGHPTAAALKQNKLLWAKKLWACIAAFMLLAMAMHYYALPHRTSITVKSNESKSAQQIRVPALLGRHEIRGSDFHYTVQLDYNNWPLQQTGFQMLSNGCIRKIHINGINFPFRNSSGCNPAVFSYWSPYNKPLYLDFANALKSGPNTIEVLSSKAEFDMGPVMYYNSLGLSKWLCFLMALVAVTALFIITQHFTGSNTSGYIMAAALLMHLYRFTHSNVIQNSMDMPGHLAYVTQIATFLRWPAPYSGWSYYHPPLYYTLQAMVLRFGNWLGSFDPLTLMQAFSLLCFLVFLVFSMLSLRRIIQNTRAFNTVLALLAFYPSGLLFSSHIDSHLLFYACYAACTYFMLRWMDSGRNRHAGLILAFIGIGIATRSNALILLPMAGLVLLYNISSGRVPVNILKRWSVRAGLAVLVVGMLMNFGRTEYFHIKEKRNEPLLVGNIIRLSGGLYIGHDNIIRTLTPNIRHYLTHPFWSVWGDAEGRQYFWNSMLKSSLTGEFNWDKGRTAQRMGNALLALILYIIDAYILHRQTFRQRNEWSICFFSLSIAVAALFANRWLFPFACSEDFRYIYPSIASFCGLAGLAIEQNSRDWRPFRTALGIGICMFFVYCSVMFYA